MHAGSAIIRSHELLESFWSQVNSLMDSLLAMTTIALKDKQFKDFQSAGTAKYPYRTSDSTWTYTDYAISYPMMGAKCRVPKPTEWINYQISVAGAGIPPQDGSAQDEHIGPLLHVSFWQVETDFDDSNSCVRFPFESDDYDIKDSRLIFWEKGGSQKNPQWTFSIRLFEINSEDDIRNSVIKPIIALLAGEPVAQALPATLPGLVAYADRGQDDGPSTLVAYDAQAL